MSYIINNEDAIDFLSKIEDQSIDLIITDPPYESLEKHRSIGTTTRLKKSKSSSNIWFDIFPNDRFESLFDQCYRVLKNDRHFYLFCDQETAFLVKDIGERAGFKFWKPIIWDKMKIGMGYHYRSRYEFILFFEKGKRKLNDLSIPDVLSVSKVFNRYPTEKPVALNEILINQSTQISEIILDPFCGSGSTGVAAVLNQRNFIGNDLAIDAVKITTENIEQILGSKERIVL